jgi:23S rRNA pseudouridine2605 synthase
MSGHSKDESRGGASGQAGERVAKALARAGVASRRDIERMIAEGRVALNGKILDTPAVKVGPGDALSVDGKPVAQAEAARVWRYHKPTGLVTTHKDPKGRPTVFEHLPPGLPRVISVGRLDLNSEGLLLLTNDGGLARALELPATGLARRYRARARGHVTQAKLDTLKDGLTVEGVRYGSIEATLDKARDSAGGANLWITLTLAEGKNREVRRVLEALGLTVNRLIRLAYGPFQLGDLAPGEAEEVGPRVVREQLGALIDPANVPTGVRAAPAPAVVTEREDRRPSRRAPTPKRGEAKRAEPRSTKPDERKDKAEYKPGWAKPKKRAAPHHIIKAPKTAPASRGARPEAKPSSPRPQKAGARPPRSSGAHRKGPPTAGGPKPRG